MVSRADQNEVYAELARPGGWNGITVFMNNRKSSQFQIRTVFELC